MSVTERQCRHLIYVLCLIIHNTEMHTHKSGICLLYNIYTRKKLISVRCLVTIEETDVFVFFPNVDHQSSRVLSLPPSFLPALSLPPSLLLSSLPPREDCLHCLVIWSGGFVIPSVRPSALLPSILLLSFVRLSCVCPPSCSPSVVGRSQRPSLGSLCLRLFTVV